MARMVVRTLGVEEELLLVDARTRALAHVAEDVLARADHPPDRLAHEAYAAEVEARTPIVNDVTEAVTALGESRLAARALAIPESAPNHHGEFAARPTSSGRWRRMPLNAQIAVSGSGIPTWTWSAHSGVRWIRPRICSPTSR